MNYVLKLWASRVSGYVLRNEELHNYMDASHQIVRLCFLGGKIMKLFMDVLGHGRLFGTPVSQPSGFPLISKNSFYHKAFPSLP